MLHLILSIMLELINSDLIINVVSHMNVVDSGKFALTSKRFYYLVHQYRTILGPELVVCSSLENGKTRPVSDLYKDCVSKLSTRPNLALAFNTFKGQGLSSQLRTDMPGDSVVLGAVAESIQANVHGEVQCDSSCAVMMGSLSTEQTQMAPFVLPRSELAILLQQLERCTPEGICMRVFWKVFIVYVCRSAYYSVDSFVSDLQVRFPEATIVGGICESGYVSRNSDFTIEELKQKETPCLLEMLEIYDGAVDEIDHSNRDVLVERILHFMNQKKYHVHDVYSGIFGLALGGDVPVRSIVSRGVRSLTSTEIVPSEAPSEWFVDEVSLMRPSDEGYLFRGDPELLKPVHVVRRLWSSITDKVVCPMELIARFEQKPEYIGIRRPGTDGFQLNVLSPFSLLTNFVLLMTDGSREDEVSLEKANIDFFTLDPKACLEHIDMTLGKLREQTKDDVILASVMFSCNGRGPEQMSMLRERMADAQRFNKYFPDTPCVGFYAGGEIGPMALVGNRDIFQKGKAAVQGFTAVFLLFIVPEAIPGAFHFDDSNENVAKYLEDRLSVMTMSI